MSMYIALGVISKESISLGLLQFVLVESVAFESLVALFRLAVSDSKISTSTG